MSSVGEMPCSAKDAQVGVSALAPGSARYQTVSVLPGWRVFVGPTPWSVVRASWGAASFAAEVSVMRSESSKVSDHLETG